MQKSLVAQRLVERLNRKLQSKLDLSDTLILGVVLKGLPIAYGLATMNGLIDNFIPLVAQRHIYMQHQVESYFPSQEWKDHFTQQLTALGNLMIVDDVVNSGFTKQRVESVVHSLDNRAESRHTFAALVLNRGSLANRRFVHSRDVYSVTVEAKDVECDWGQMTVPLWDLPIKEALKRCEEYFRKFWIGEKRFVTVTY